MENNNSFWWLQTPHSSSVVEIEDLSYSITKDNLRNYLDGIFFPFGYTPYYPVYLIHGAEDRKYE